MMSVNPSIIPCNHQSIGILNINTSRSNRADLRLGTPPVSQRFLRRSREPMPVPPTFATFKVHKSLLPVLRCEHSPALRAQGLAVFQDSQVIMRSHDENEMENGGVIWGTQISENIPMNPPRCLSAQVPVLCCSFSDILPNQCFSVNQSKLESVPFA